MLSVVKDIVDVNSQYQSYQSIQPMLTAKARHDSARPTSVKTRSHKSRWSEHSVIKMTDKRRIQDTPFATWLLGEYVSRNMRLLALVSSIVVQNARCSTALFLHDSIGHLLVLMHHVSIASCIWGWTEMFVSGYELPIRKENLRQILWKSGIQAKLVLTRQSTLRYYSKLLNLTAVHLH